MREVPVTDIAAAVEKLFIEANIDLHPDVLDRLTIAVGEEMSPAGKEVLRELLMNAETAAKERIPICQDTGLAILFIEVGQDVHLTGGPLKEAVTAGVRDAYAKGYLRKSCCDPFTRKNTGTTRRPSSTRPL